MDHFGRLPGIQSLIWGAESLRLEDSLPPLNSDRYQTLPPGTLEVLSRLRVSAGLSPSSGTESLLVQRDTPSSSVASSSSHPFRGAGYQDRDSLAALAFVPPRARELCQGCEALRELGLPVPPPRYRDLIPRAQPPRRDFQLGLADILKQHPGANLANKMLDLSIPRVLNIVFLELKPHLAELMIHPFAWGFVQKIIWHCEDYHKMEFLQILTRSHASLVRISCDIHGTRSVQKLFGRLQMPEQVQMAIAAIVPVTFILINDINGHHVINFCLDCFSAEQLKDLVDEIDQNCIAIATNKNGCCLLQRCLAKAEGQQKERMIAKIIENALLLSEDFFGNYIIQYVLHLKNPVITTNIVKALEGKFTTLAMQKYGSNVVERCLETSGEWGSTKIINELLDDRTVLQVLQNGYGNFVMQSALGVSKGTVRQAIEDVIKENYDDLHNHPYGKNVVARTELKKNRK